MVDFTGLDANVAVVRFVGRFGASLPETPFNALTQAIAEPDGLKALTMAVEALYASREEIGIEGRELLRDLTAFLTSRNLAGYGANGRGIAILAVANRVIDGGEETADGDPDLDPAMIAPPEPVLPPDAPGPVADQGAA